MEPRVNTFYNLTMRTHLDTAGSTSFSFGILVEHNFSSFPIIISNYTRRLLASLTMKRVPCIQKLGLIGASLGKFQIKGMLRHGILNFTSLTATSFPSHTQVNEFSLFCYFLSFIHFPLFTTISNFNLNMFFFHILSPLFPDTLFHPLLSTFTQTSHLQVSLAHH